jgi:cytochrome c peroxidase
MELRTPEEVLERLRNLDGYTEAFRRAFPGDPAPFTFDHLAQAIAAFERTLVAPGRFDKLLDGQKDALTPREKRGLTKFVQYHCVECHTGVTVGGQFFRILGQRHPYTATEDLGLYETTKKAEDRFIFKVPMLRNVTRTAPYFSDGKVADLKEAVRLMGWHQLDLRLTPGDTSDLIAFLGTLEGNPPPVKAPGK